MILRKVWLIQDATYISHYNTIPGTGVIIQSLGACHICANLVLYPALYIPKSNLGGSEAPLSVDLETPKHPKVAQVLKIQET